VDLLTDVAQRMLHPVPERADVELLKVDASWPSLSTLSRPRLWFT
jgi:hypothetical protein